MCVMSWNRVRAPLLVALAVCCAAPGRPALAESAPSGEQIFRQQCASCHGRDGEGTKRYRKRLAGDKSIPQLTKVIAQTMPDDDPGTLSTAQAERVAAYIHQAFYSAAARERNRPPRIELARLTVRQYRSTVADLVGSFRPAVRFDEQRGLKAEYYRKRYFDGGARVLERIDPQVRFDFGTGSPLADKIQPHEFAIRWTGSVLAPETGLYEFVVRTEHATRLWVNDLNRPLIDAWVKSGNDREYRASLFLVGGRPYPLRLEYSKGKQGVDDSKTTPKPPPTPSSIALCWARPHRAVEPIPSRCLAPTGNPETFVLATPFPPDDSSYGWERGTTISREWHQAATEAAVETAGYVAAHINALAGTHDGDGERDTKARAFCRRFAERAFRRPLTAEQKRFHVDRQFDAAKDLETAVKRVVLLVLESPQFLYREVAGGTDGHDVAARLSFGLWDSLPDEELLRAAAEGKLTTREQVMRQAERMLGDLRARTRLRQFLLAWARADQPREVAKDLRRFPGFDAAAISDLRTSLELFLDEVAGDSAGDFRRLLLADHLYLNGRLARFYGADLPADADFQRVKPAGERAGVLTHPYLMAALAYTAETSPVHRGVFVARGILGVSLKPPPEAFAPLAADLHPSLTTRERVALQTKPATCMACHGIINPLGYTLEHFDAIGRYRDRDNAKPVDATGTYLARDGRTVTFTGARQLAEYLAGSTEVHEAFVEQMFHTLVQQPVRAYGPQALTDLRRAFAASGFNIRKLAVEIMTVSALTPRRVKP
jgi:cytochrome c553